jgi:hypothetical protein
MLVLRYHAHRFAEASVGGGNDRIALDRLGAMLFFAFKVALAVAAFLWLRRLARHYLEAERARLTASRTSPAHPARAEDGIQIGIKALGPASWLGLVLLAWWLTPVAARALMEARLLLAMLLWLIGGWLAVVLFDALAAQSSRRQSTAGRDGHDALRMRSLRLVGGLVVAAGVILTATNQIVGPGTIYSWVAGLCWLLALPVGLLLAGWWREITLARLTQQRRRTRFEAWLIAHQQGWRGRVVTVIAAAYLFCRGAWTLLSGWIGQFDLTRRTLAYVFRRNLDRLGEQRATWSHEPLPAQVRARLGPAVASDELIAIAPRKAGRTEAWLLPDARITALVGERGSGRSTMLANLRQPGRTIAVDCPFEGFQALAGRIAAQAGLPSRPAGGLADVLDTLGTADATTPATRVIDNAHRPAQPLMGGLADLALLVEIARQHQGRNTWVLSFDRVVWQFLARARPVELLFDSVVELPAWTEEQIRQLLEVRSSAAGLAPDYELLLPAEINRLDPVEREDVAEDAAMDDAEADDTPAESNVIPIQQSEA